MCGETIGWERDHPGVAISKHFKNSELEWFTTKRAAIIPYRILIKTETPKYRVKWPFGTYTMPKVDVVKCDAQDVWRIGDEVKATTTLDFKERGKVESNDIGRIKKLMSTDKDVLYVDFQLQRVWHCKEGDVWNGYLSKRPKVESAGELDKRRFPCHFVKLCI